MDAARVLESYEPVVAAVPPPTLRAVEAADEQALHDPRVAAADRRRCRHAAGLNDLMDRRLDLHGVSRVADHVTEFTRWMV